MILEWNWLSKSVPTQYHLKKKIILGIRALSVGCVRANHRLRGPVVTAGRHIRWVLIKITSDKFTSACLLGWKEGFSPKSTMMNWNLSGWEMLLALPLGCTTSLLCFSFCLPTLSPSPRKQKVDTGRGPSLSLQQWQKEHVSSLLICLASCYLQPLCRLFLPWLLKATSPGTTEYARWFLCLFTYGRNALW